MLECRVNVAPEMLASKIKIELGSTLCHFLHAESGITAGRFCREGEKEMININIFIKKSIY